MKYTIVILIFLYLLDFNINTLCEDYLLYYHESYVIPEKCFEAELSEEDKNNGKSCCHLSVGLSEDLTGRAECISINKEDINQYIEKKKEKNDLIYKIICSKDEIEIKKRDSCLKINPLSVEDCTTQELSESDIETFSDEIIPDSCCYVSYYSGITFTSCQPYEKSKVNEHLKELNNNNFQNVTFICGESSNTNTNTNTNNANTNTNNANTNTNTTQKSKGSNLNNIKFIIFILFYILLF